MYDEFDSAAFSLAKDEISDLDMSELFSEDIPVLVSDSDSVNVYILILYDSCSLMNMDIAYLMSGHVPQPSTGPHLGE